MHSYFTLQIEDTLLFTSFKTHESKMKFTLVAVAGLATANAFSTSSFMGKTSMNVPKSSSALDMKYKVAVVGGGPSGACAAEIFAQEKGIDTVMFERKLDNAKPCGGAIPLCMVGEFDIPETVVDRKVRRSRWEESFTILDTIFLTPFLSFLLGSKNESCFPNWCRGRHWFHSAA